MNILLMAAMTVSLSMGITSCSDDDKDDNGGNGSEKTEAEYEQEQLGWSIITQLTDERVAPDGWENKTFEPTIGTAKEGDPYTRVVMTNDVETAASRYSDLIGTDVNPANTGYNFSMEGIGSLNYQRGSENDEYLAQVTVDIKQMPHLKKILYQTERQAGMNATVNGTAYYRFGDVVTDADGFNWICVRPSFGPEGKGDSHWISVSDYLPEKNLYKYEYKGKSWAVPTGLGCSKEHMQNLAELLFAILKPADWLNNLNASTKPAMFHDFSTSRIQYHSIYFWQRVSKAWEKENIFKNWFRLSADELLAKLNGDGISFVYNGYSWYTKTSWNCSLFEATYKNGTGKQANMHNATYTKPTKRMENLTVDFSEPDKSVNGDFFDKDKKCRYIVRYKTGKQLSSTGVYDPKTRISGCTDVYVYNRYYYQDTKDRMYDLNNDPEVTTEEMFLGDYYIGEPYYRPGDVVKDEDGALWFCIQPSGCDPDFAEQVEQFGKDYVCETFKTPLSATQYSWFISLTPRGTNGQSLFQKYGHTYLNVPTLDEARIITFLISQMLWDGIWGKKPDSHQWSYSYRNILEHAKVDLTKLVVRRDSLFDAMVNKPNHVQNMFTNMVYRHYYGNTQEDRAYYLRFIYDGCGLDQDSEGNNKPGTRLNKLWHQNYYTAGGYTKGMILGDLTDKDKVKEYAYDKWVTLPWYTVGNAGPGQGDGISTDIYPHEQIRTTTYRFASAEDYLWDDDKKDFAKPEYTSMYNEPVFVCRLMKVKDRGQKATETTDGKKLIAEYLTDFGGNRGTGVGILEQLTPGIGGSGPYNYNGVEMRALWNLPLLGEEVKKQQ